MHFASFNGNLEMCQMLIEEGAQIDAVNIHGLNCLHTAAQGDQPASLYFFHKIWDLDIKRPDLKGSTPLHWAIFSHSELALSYVIAWMNQQGIPLDAQDYEGQTPIHMAIKIADKIESARPVRTLLFNSAPKDIPDH